MARQGTATIIEDEQDTETTNVRNIGAAPEAGTLTPENPKRAALVKTIVENVVKTIEALRGIGATIMADTIEQMATLYHMVAIEETVGKADEALGAVLDPFTANQKVLTGMVVARARGRTEAYHLGRENAPAMSRQLMVLYKDLGRWQAALVSDSGYFKAATAAGPGEHHPGSPDGEWDTEEVRRWKHDKVIYIRDSSGEGDYHTPVEALRAGRGFAMVHAAFRSIIRYRPMDLSEVPGQAERAAFVAGPLAGVPIKERRKDKTTGKVKLQKVTKPVVASENMLKGYLRGLAVGAVRKGTVDSEQFLALCESAVTFAREHAAENSDDGAADGDDG